MTHYVDDSTNIIGHTNTDTLTNYLTDFYTLLHYYYNINKLSINADKTELMTIAKRSMRSLADKVYVRVLNYIIKPKEKTRILGYIISNNLSHDCYINHIISKINFRIHVFCKIKQYLPANYRTTLNAATILSLFYSPLLINCTTKQLSTLNTLLLKAAREP